MIIFNKIFGNEENLYLWVRNKASDVNSTIEKYIKNFFNTDLSSGNPLVLWNLDFENELTAKQISYGLFTLGVTCTIVGLFCSVFGCVRQKRGSKQETKVMKLQDVERNLEALLQNTEKQGADKDSSILERVKILFEELSRLRETVRDLNYRPVDPIGLEQLLDNIEEQKADKSLSALGRIVILFNELNQLRKRVIELTAYQQAERRDLEQLLESTEEQEVEKIPSRLERIEALFEELKQVLRVVIDLTYRQEEKKLLCERKILEQPLETKEEQEVEKIPSRVELVEALFDELMQLHKTIIELNSQKEEKSLLEEREMLEELLKTIEAPKACIIPPVVERIETLFNELRKLREDKDPDFRFERQKERILELELELAASRVEKQDVLKASKLKEVEVGAMVQQYRDAEHLIDTLEDDEGNAPLPLKKRLEELLGRKEIELKKNIEALQKRNGELEAALKKLQKKNKSVSK